MCDIVADIVVSIRVIPLVPIQMVQVEHQQARD